MAIKRQQSALSDILGDEAKCEQKNCNRQNGNQWTCSVKGQLPPVANLTWRRVLQILIFLCVI